MSDLPPERLSIDPSEVSALWAFAGSLTADADAALPVGPMPLTDHFRMLQRLSVKAGDETCHLSQRPLAVGTTDFVVETLADARTIEDAMKRVARTYNLLHGGFFNRVERRRDRLIYVIDDRDFPYAFSADSAQAHATVEGLMIFLHAMLSLAAGQDLSPRLVQVRTRRPRRRLPDGFLTFWSSPVKVAATTYALEYDAALADAPVALAPKGGAIDVYGAIEAMIVERERIGSPTDFIQRVTDVIVAGVDDQEEAANRLGVSVATLRRRLTTAGTRFRDLRAACLNDRAKTMLHRHRHPDDVAEALGFSDSRSFSRAFKAWNGVTPAIWANRVSEIVLTD